MLFKHVVKKGLMNRPPARPPAPWQPPRNPDNGTSPRSSCLDLQHRDAWPVCLVDAGAFPIAGDVSRRHGDIGGGDCHGAVLSRYTVDPVAAGFGKAHRARRRTGKLALFWWAIVTSRKARLRFAFAPDDPHSLLTDGPYGYVRHPFYTSYIIFWIGWGIATWSIWAVVPVAGIAILYVFAALDEEKKFSRTPLAGCLRGLSRPSRPVLAAAGVVAGTGAG